MRTESDIFSYYKEYIENTQCELKKYNERLVEANEIVNVSKIYIDKNKENIKNILNINLDNYATYRNNVLDSKNTELIDKVIDIYKNKDCKNTKKLMVLHLIRYLKNLERSSNCKIKIEALNMRAIMSFDKFRSYVRRYYTQVQKEVLEGNVYKFSNAIGEFFINRVKNVKGEDYKGRLNFAATNKRKKEIIASGKTPYNHEDFLECERKGIKYNGVEYMVYLKEPYLYEFVFANMRLKGGNYMKFERTDYRNTSLRGMTDDEITLLIEDRQDIFDLDADIRVKLKQLLKFDPTVYINYIRNDEQTKFKYRKIIR